MGVAAGPLNSRDGLILWYDIANIKSFRGEPTTNLARKSRDFSGTQYASEDEWVSSEPTRLTKTYVATLSTPIGLGATLIQESGNTGYHHLSRFGGGEESGTHFITCFIFPLSTTITDFSIGLLADAANSITFNLQTGVITYGASISNRNAFLTPVPGFNGWYRVGANFEGRGGGWVGCVGYSIYSSYTGTNGGKQLYITGMQYEYKARATAFIEAGGTRGTTVATGGGLIDLAGSSNGELVNGPTASTLFGGYLSFDGNNDYCSTSVTNLPIGAAARTLSLWFRYEDYSSTFFSVCGYGAESTGRTFDLIITRSTQKLNLDSYGGGYGIVTTTSVLPGVWYHVSAVYTGTEQKLYLNGVLESSQVKAIDTASSNLILGKVTWGTPGYLKGDIAHLSLYNKALTTSEISQLYQSLRTRFITRQSIITNGLILHLDAGSISSYRGSGTVVTDLSGYGNNGTLTNGPGFRGNNGGQFTLDGTNDYIVIPHNSIFNFGTGGFTIMLVISSEQLKGYTAYIKKGGPTEWGNSPAGWYATSANGVGDLAWYWVFANGTSHTEIPPASTFSKSNDTFGLNFFSISRDVSGNIHRCWNGVYELAATNWTSSFDNSSDIWIGRGNTNYLKGKFPMVLIYNRALSQSEVLQNFEATRARFGL